MLCALTAAAPASAAPAIATCGGPGDGWKTTRSDPGLQVNLVVLNDSGTQPTWNGITVTEQQVRQYVGITAQMKPVPVFVLVVSPHADCGEASAYRKMASELLNCEQGKCVEVDP